MKLHNQLARGLWDETTSLSLSCKRLRPLVPKLNGIEGVASATTEVTATTATTIAAFDLKSFIRPNSGPRKLALVPSSDIKRDPLQVETAHPGGTRWNPTQEQIGILEALYCRGMRTPNAHQIEQITTQLSEYGKIEGKNVFYWFQNHKARERQKQKRNLSQSPKTTTTSLPSTHDVVDSSSITLSFDSTKEETKRGEQTTPTKRKDRSWTFERFIDEGTPTPNINMLDDYINRLYEEEDGYGDARITLELFPLHPETR